MNINHARALVKRSRFMAHQNKIGIGIIGTGFARSTQLPAFRACEGAHLAAIASGHLENAERVAREFEIPFATADWRDIVAREDVDLISIVTPPSTHAEMTLAALDAGKAVLCEKPLAMNSEETGRMRQRAAETGLLAHVDHELRFLPARIRMRELILAGEIGKVRHAAFHFRADSRATPERGWDWWSDARAGGGVLGAIGSHAVDTLHWLLGASNGGGARISQVNATLATHVSDRRDERTGEMRAVTTDDEANMLVHFSGGDVLAQGATGVIAMSVVEPGEPEHRVEVFGSDGALKIDDGKLFRAKVGGRAWELIETESAPLAEGMGDNEWSRGLTIFAREIVETLRAGRNVVEGAATFEDGHRTQLVLDAARSAHDGGCRVTVAD